MRSKGRMALGVLAAVVAVTAVSTTSALAAAPEFVHCVAKKGGKYAAGCTGTGTGFEKEAVKNGSSIKFTASGGESRFEIPGQSLIDCTKSTSSGEIAGPKTVANVVFKYTHCTRGEATCGTVTVESREITTNALTGTLEYISPAAKTVKESLVGPENVELKKGEWGHFKCITAGWRVFNRTATSFFGKVTPVNKLEPTSDLTFPQAGGLEAFEEPLTVNTSDRLTFSEPIEIIA
jgi:uncharacterized membrane protein